MANNLERKASEVAPLWPECRGFMHISDENVTPFRRSAGLCQPVLRGRRRHA